MVNAEKQKAKYLHLIGDSNLIFSPVKLFDSYKLKQLDRGLFKNFTSFELTNNFKLLQIVHK